MTRRAHLPERLDVAALAADGAEISGRWPLPELPRLTADEPLGADPSTREVTWSARGERRRVGGGDQTWLHLQAQAQAQRECQRCLQPVTVALDVDRWLRFVPDENTAAAMDAELDEDVLTLEPRLDLRQLVEDELLLALPIVPRHEECPEPLPLPQDDDAEPAAEHPFAALAALRRAGSGH